MTAGVKSHPWPVYLPQAECFLQLLMEILEDLGSPLDVPCPLPLPFDFLRVFWIVDFWLFIYLSPSQCCPGGCTQWVGSSISLYFGIKKQSSTSWQPTPVFDLEQLASECGFLPPSPPVTSSLLSTSHLLSKIFSYFVFPELFIMQARRTISLLEK